MKKFAVFDIDGTLIRWQLFHAIADELGRRGNVPTESYEKVRVARMVWKQRTHGTSFREYEHELVKAYDTAVTGLPVKDFMVAVRHVFDEYKDQVYAYTRDLIRDLKAKDYLLFALSGSQSEVVGLLADYYGFDGYAGSTYEQLNGKFTGKCYALRRERKIAALEKLITTYHVERSGSIAVGDSDSDIPMLEYVEQPIAFNPNDLLFQHAQSRSWKVVIERKNMIYELGQKNGKYILV